MVSDCPRRESSAANSSTAPSPSSICSPGLKLALWAQKNIAHDTGLPETQRAPTSFTVAQNVRSKEEVDQVMGQARSAGATIVKEAQDTFYGGYAGYFQDLDGHLWEIAFNPAMLPEDD